MDVTNNDPKTENSGGSVAKVETGSMAHSGGSNPASGGVRPVSKPEAYSKEEYDWLKSRVAKLEAVIESHFGIDLGTKEHK